MAFLPDLAQVGISDTTMASLAGARDACVLWQVPSGRVMGLSLYCWKCCKNTPGSPSPWGTWLQGRLGRAAVCGESGRHCGQGHPPRLDSLLAVSSPMG